MRGKHGTELLIRMFSPLNLYLFLRTCSRLLPYGGVSLPVALSLGIKHARSFSSHFSSASFYATSCNATQEWNMFFCSVLALTTSEQLHVYIIFIYSKQRRGSILLRECQSRSGRKPFYCSSCRSCDVGFFSPSGLPDSVDTIKPLHRHRFESVVSQDVEI